MARLNELRRVKIDFKVNYSLSDCCYFCITICRGFADYQKEVFSQYKKEVFSNSIKK